jgi:hypothetical protein
MQRFRATLEAMAEIGRALIAARSRCARGASLPWLKANCPDIGERQAERYMKAAKSDTMSNLPSFTRATLETIQLPRK